MWGSMAGVIGSRGRRGRGEARLAREGGSAGEEITGDQAGSKEELFVCRAEGVCSVSVVCVQYFMNV